MPVIVTDDVPVVAVALAFRVKVLVFVVGFVLNAAVTPEGKPEAESVTLPLKPFAGTTEIVLLPWPLSAIVRLAGFGVRV